MRALVFVRHIIVFLSNRKAPLSFSFTVHFVKSEAARLLLCQLAVAGGGEGTGPLLLLAHIYLLASQLQSMVSVFRYEIHHAYFVVIAAPLRPLPD